MANSPTQDSNGVLKLSILSNGSPIDEAIQVISVSVNKAVNKIPSAKIVLMDGDMPEKDFPVSNSDAFVPGQEITIKAGYDQNEEPIFTGIVIKHGIKVTGDNFSRLVIECRDKAVAMTLGRHNANYVDSKDSDVISKIISNHAGLSADVTATTTQHGELVQYYCSDWDFVLSRAEVNGQLVCCEDAKVSVKAPDTSAAAELLVTYGEDLMEFHADMDARHQVKEVKSANWDPSQQTMVEESVAPAKLNEQGNLDSATLAEVLNLEPLRLQTPISMETSALRDWASGQQIKSGLSRIRGRMKFQGSAKAKPASLIELDGVGERFNGNVFASAVNHDIANGNWITEVEFGMSPNWFAEQRDLVAPPAAGLLPGVEGLQIAVVKQLDEDPNGEFRIQVTVPVLQADTEGVWARLAGFYASDSYGSFFIPEIGDEVVLGYLNNDPTAPVILGSLYSSKRAPAYTPEADNNTKALVTRSELKIEFDDDKKVITVETPGGNKIVISDDAKSIVLEDQNSNKIELGESGIVLDSPKDISITAKGEIKLDATSNLSATSKADVSIDGLNVNQTANASFTAKGSASAELSASGQTTVKGAMVMIN